MSTDRFNYDDSYVFEGYDGRWTLIDLYHGLALFESEEYGSDTYALACRQTAHVVDRTYADKAGRPYKLPTITKDNEVVETYDPLSIVLRDGLLEED